jgi:general secretion pathway protein D
LVPTGTTRLGYDPTDNSIIFQGTDEAYQQLLDLIEQFDRAPRQVIIEVEFVTTSNSNERSLGIDWLYERGTVFAGNRPGTFARASDPIFINWASGNVTTRLRTIMTDGFGRTVSKPVIRTMNNQLAAVQAQTQTTVFLTTTSVSNGTVIQSVNPQTLNISTQLVVRPRINNDGTITVGLNPQIQDFGQLRRSADGQEIPDVLSQVISVVARVKDGETIALGGLTRKQDTFSTSRIPLLSDLPIVGQLFRGRSQQQTSSELLVFVTPTIVKDDSGMAP